MRILVLSPRVAPGIMTVDAWDALRAATVVHAAVEDGHVRAVVASGIAVKVSTDPPSYAPGTVWIAPTGDTAWARTVADDLMSAGPDIADIEVVFGSYDLPGSGLLDVVDVMDRLRRECPWTAQQTHETLSHYLLEEAHETLEALDTGDSDHLREELGDLLMQIVFHARIAAEGEGWDIDDVAAGIAGKLVYRNPHVFGNVTVGSAEEVDANWQRLKATEKQRTSPFDGIPTTLPALAYADKVLSRFGDVDITGTDLGARLLSLVRDARAQGENAEEALRQATRAPTSR
ncbi:MazG family protein [Aeromicrobium sp.]|uniref:MazG family protein n=1 Tax=Aeromicrobium sp. TaxID=1871063 RepID=UPI0019C05226|nr:MazG family protein [Aeromicrobium sp.]MBC7631231.1 MazG family protein [Aeromicrobium sp.]